jgi:hypothetical protein
MTVELFLLPEPITFPNRGKLPITPATTMEKVKSTNAQR